MTKENWERKLFCLLTPALMGDPFTLAAGHATKTIALGVPAHWFLGHGALHAFALVEAVNNGKRD
jgi:hypothetical protein